MIIKNLSVEETRLCVVIKNLQWKKRGYVWLLRTYSERNEVMCGY